jgi:hypothetical protein
MVQLTTRKMTVPERRKLLTWLQTNWSPPKPCPTCGSVNRTIPLSVTVAVESVSQTGVRSIVVECDCGHCQTFSPEFLGIR